MIGIAIHLCWLALVAICLWFLLGALQIPEPWRRVCQIIIVLIAVLDAAGAIGVGAGATRTDLGGRPLIAAPPSIVAPERGR